MFYLGVNSGDVTFSGDDIHSTVISSHSSHAAWADTQLNTSAIPEPPLTSFIGMVLLGLISFRIKNVA